MATHTYQLVISYTVGGQFAQNILHYQFDDSGFSDTAHAADALNSQFDTANTALLKGMLSVHTNILSYKSRALDVQGGFESVLFVAGSPAGTRAGNLSVAAVGPVIILYPTQNAKPRGRVFLPGASDTDLIDGNFTAAFQGAVASLIHMFTDTMVLPGGGGPVATPVVYTRRKGTAVVPQSRLIEYARLSLTAGTQRRRQRPA